MDCLKKTSFGNNFSTMVMLQDQTEKLLKTFVDIKKYVDENIWRMKTFSPNIIKSQAKAKKQK